MINEIEQPNIKKWRRILDSDIGVTAIYLILLGFGALFTYVILPEEVSNRHIDYGVMAWLLPVCMIFALGILWYKYRGSVYFIMSARIISAIVVSAASIMLSNIFGGTIGSRLLLYPSGFFFAVFMTMKIVRDISMPLKPVQYELKNIAKGHLSDVKIDLSQYASEFVELASNFNTMKMKLKEVILVASKNTEMLASTSEEMAATSEEVNATTEEIAATIQQISRGASTQSDLSAKSIDDINEMSRIVDQSLDDIENTLKVIEDIAGQTNILALNAAIEAARAGEKGKGFAVVADNVRKLAEETKKNASDISTLTEVIIQNLGSNIKKLQDTFQDLAAQSEEFSASSEEVAAATEEQTASMDEMTTTAQKLAEQSEALSKIVAHFKL